MTVGRFLAFNNRLLQISHSCKALIKKPAAWSNLVRQILQLHENPIRLPFALPMPFRSGPGCLDDTRL